jgi:hypothetical protein
VEGVQACSSVDLLRTQHHCCVQQCVQRMQCCFMIGWQRFSPLFIVPSRSLLQDTINGLAGCLLRAKDDMTSPSGKRLVRAASLPHLDRQYYVLSHVMSHLAFSSVNQCCPFTQLELIVEARNLKKTLGFLQPELLAQYAKQVWFKFCIGNHQHCCFY